MKYFYHIFTVFVLTTLVILNGCTKSQLQTNDFKQDVSFSSKKILNKPNSINLLKSVPLSVDYAIIGIDDNIYKIPTYQINGTIYTTSIKLNPGNFTLSKFILMNNGGSESDSTDDIPVYALPQSGSEYAAFVNHPAGFHFNVNSLEKKEVSLEVLSFQPDNYQKFGFNFNILPNTIIRNQFFKGIFIPVDYNLYTGSLYQSQTNGLQPDMPAIFRIDVYRNGNFVKSYSNEEIPENESLKVSYPDSKQNPDSFRFDLFLYAKSGNSFEYRFIHSWKFSDDELLHHGNNGIVDFSIGDAQQQVDYSFGPYINLPLNCMLTVDPGYAPGSRGSYFDGQTQNIASGYHLTNNIYRFWCGTDTVAINMGYSYSMDVFSSLSPESLPAYTRNSTQWNEINWLFNNLNNYPFYDWDILQGAVWMILNNWNGTGHSNVSDANSIVIRMANDARNHSDFIPDFGQKAAIIFIPKNTHHEEQNPKVQVVFTLLEI